MSCEQFQRWLILKDSLIGDETAVLKEHLQACLACYRLWQQQERLRELLSALPKVTPSPSDRQRLLERLAEMTPVPELDCATARRKIWLWLDGQLLPDEQKVLFIHLAGCDLCQAQLWQAERYAQAMRMLPNVRASTADKEALKAKLFRQRPKPVSVFVWRAMPFVATAAVILLAVLSYLAWWSPLQPPQPSPIIAKAPPSPPSLAVRELPTPPTTVQHPKVAQIPSPKSEQRFVRKPVTPPVADGRKVMKPTSTPIIPKHEVIAQQEQVEPERQPQPVEPEAPSPVSPVIVELPASPQMPEPSEPTVLAAQPSVSPEPKPTTPSPAIAQPTAEQRQLILLEPVTIEREESLAPPRLCLSVLPPSQQLYRQFGVALKTVPSEKQLKVGETFPTDASIPLTAERYRSKTAILKLLQFSVSWQPASK